MQGIGERFDIIVDFKGFDPGTKLYLVNLVEHEDGSKPNRFVSLADALAGKSGDPAVGKFLEFRVATPAAQPDMSMNPEDYVEGGKTMISVPVFTRAELASARVAGPSSSGEAAAPTKSRGRSRPTMARG